MYLSLNESNRYIPDLRTNNMITNLGLSRIEPLRASVTEQSYNHIPSDESPFNPILYENVKYSTNPYITHRNRVVSKYENNNPGNNNIALYDTHKYSLNALNEPFLANNQLHTNLMQTAREKIRFKESDLLSSYGNPDSTNGYIYNPNLPPSETNIIPSCGTDGFYYGNNSYSSINLDPRLNQHTNERAWNYESTRSDIAYDLQRANFIKERNHRQHEADDALQRRTKKDRWVEPKMAYMNRKQNPLYQITSSENITTPQKESIQKIAIADYGRNEPSDYKLSESFIRARNDMQKNPPLDSHSYNVREAEIYRNYNPEYLRHMNEIYAKDIPNIRKENYSAPESSRTNIPTTTKANKHKKSFFKWNITGDRDGKPQQDSTLYRTNHENNKITYYNDPSFNQKDYVPQKDMSKDLKQSTSAKERFIYKPDHILIIKNNNTVGIYPNDTFMPGKIHDAEYQETASSIIIADPYKPSMIKNMCMLIDNKFILLQKLSQDSIFTGDYRKVGEDLISIELPIEALSKKFREHIQKYNTSTNRDKVLNLTYDDYIELIKFVETHPNLQQRLKLTHLHARVRTDDYNKELINNFYIDELSEGQKIFVENKVYTDLAANYRKKFEQKQKGRIDKQLYSLSQTENNTLQFTPTNESFTHNAQNTNRQYTGSNTSRSNGIKRGKFD